MSISDFTAAVVQAAPVVFDRARTLDKLRDLPGLGTLEDGVLRLDALTFARLMAARIDPGMCADTGRFSQAS